MGIRYLNKYFVEHCKKCIILTNFDELSGKTIVVDISIYLYKYQMSDALIENMYLMLSLFKSHNIIPIFIFDGKPPVEKRDVLNQRYKDKVTAETKCKELYNQLENVNTNSERETILETIQTLKKKCVFLKRDDIQKVQTLITAYGYSYYVAAGEADELCALFVRYKKAWACLSEDMDMFVYGIPRVLRYISLLNRTVVLYDTYDILKSIDITIQNFIELCIMSGSDYTNVNVNDVYKLFKVYNIFKESSDFNRISFRKWLGDNAERQDIKHMDDDTFSNTRSLFVQENEDNLKIVRGVSSIPKDVDDTVVKRILEEDGFVYPK